MDGRWFGGFVGLMLLVWASHTRALDLPCRHDDVLAEAAANFLLSGRPLDAAALLPEARALGFDGVAVHAHEGSDDGALSAWMVELSQRADGPLVCGEASSETRRLVLAAVRGGALKVVGRRVYGELAPGFRAPHLVVEAGDGSLKRVDVGVRALAEGVLLAPEWEAKRVQLVADGPSGPRPVAERVLDADLLRERSVAPPAPAAEEGPRGPRARSLDALLARLDGFRRSEGVGTLRPNQALHGSAQRHARRVCELGKVGHRIDQGDDPETRLREERIAARSVGEAVARAGSADAALTAVFDSPSHRMAVTDRRFTDVGVGQAYDQKGHTCLVVLLAAWPRRLP